MFWTTVLIVLRCYVLANMARVSKSGKIIENDLNGKEKLLRVSEGASYQKSRIATYLGSVQGF